MIIADVSRSGFDYRATSYAAVCGRMLMSASMILANISLALMLAAPAADSFFPERLLGQWTDNLSNCGGEDTEGMLVTRRSVEFYEAIGTANTVRISRDGTIIADLTYKETGKVWTETNRFSIAPDRNSVRVNALGQTFSLLRCPST